MLNMGLGRQALDLCWATPITAACTQAGQAISKRKPRPLCPFYRG